MSNQAVKYILTVILLVSCPLFAQKTPGDNGESPNNTGTPQNSVLEKKSLQEFYSATKEIRAPEEEIALSMMKQNNELESRQTQKQESVFNILSSSYRNNIRFGGFWENYAIINFTPSVYIRPLDFISIYANHRHSCFIPVEGIKEHAKLIIIQGAAVLAVDNAMKFLFGSGDIIPSVAAFAVKSIIINSLMSSVNNNKKNKIKDYKSYYYSVSIRF